MGYNDLVKNVDLMTRNGQGKYTALEPDLIGVDPDEAFSRVPYENYECCWNKKCIFFIFK